MALAFSFSNEDKEKEDKHEWRVPDPGRYGFKIDECTETVFKSGRPGMKMKLLVAADGFKTDIPVFYNLSFPMDTDSDGTKWMLGKKIQELCDCVGLDVNGELSDYQLLNQTSTADFIVGEWNGRKRLEVEKFVTPQMLGIGVDSGSPHGDDNTPF